MDLILLDDGIHRRNLPHLMSLGLRLFALQGLLAPPAPLGLDGDHDIHCCDRHQDPCGSPGTAGMGPKMSWN
jgi:hypothetical protein